MPAVQVLIADDHRLFRQGLAGICRMVGDVDVVAEAENGRDAVDLALRLKPDVVLMDIRMPVLDGVQATDLITAQDRDIQVLVLTTHRDPQLVFEAIKAGARGYLLKDIDAGELLAAIRAVHRGEAVLNPLLAATVLDEFRRLSDPAAAEQRNAGPLTTGEMAVLRQVAQGDDNRRIAAQLGLAESTVANRLREVFQKLHVDNRTQAALYALRRGWASLDEA